MKTRYTVAQLRHLAEAARGDATLGAELRAQVLAHPLEYAAAIGISSRDLVRGFEGQPDDERLGDALLASLKQIGEKRREAMRATREEAAVAAAQRVTDTVSFHGDVLALNVEALLDVARGIDYVQLVDPEDNTVTVDARMLREILALREDALALVSATGLEVHWGARGRMRFVDQRLGRGAGDTVRCIFLPHLYARTTRPIARIIPAGSRATYRRTGGVVHVWNYDVSRKAYRCLTEQLGIERYIPFRELDVIEYAANDAAAE